MSLASSISIRLVVYVLCFMYWILCEESGNLYLISSLNQTWFCGRIYLITRTSRGFFLHLSLRGPHRQNTLRPLNTLPSALPLQGLVLIFYTPHFSTRRFFQSICHEKDYPNSKSLGRSSQKSFSRLIGNEKQKTHLSTKMPCQKSNKTLGTGRPGSSIQ